MPHFASKMKTGGKLLPQRALGRLRAKHDYWRFRRLEKGPHFGGAAMLKLILLATASAYVVVIATTPAGATEFEEVFTGTVASGVDSLGLFGAAGANLTGDSYKEVFFINVGPKGALTTPTSETLYGGGALGETISGELTIAGKSFYVDGDTQSSATVNSNGSRGLIQDEASESNRTSKASLSGEVATTTMGRDFPTYFGESMPVIRVGSGISSSTLLNYFVDTTLKCAEDVILKPCSAAPEPATWALLFAGIAVVGSAFRISRGFDGAKQLNGGLSGA